MKQKASQASSNEASAISALKEIACAELEFRTNGLSGDGKYSYWTRDVSGLSRLKTSKGRVGLIARTIAEADGRPSFDEDLVRHTTKVPRPHKGYLFATLTSPGDSVRTRKRPKRREKDVSISFAFAAYPSNYPHSGKYTYVISDEGKILRKDTRGKPPIEFPTPTESSWKSPKKQPPTEEALDGAVARSQAGGHRPESGAQFFILESRNLWGDYGDILIHGMTAHLGPKGGLLQLERTGPFVPPMTLPGLGDVVVTWDLKGKMQESGLFVKVTFKPVILARTVRLDWHKWNLSAEEPKSYPKGSEPENYILSRKHDPKLKEEMGELYEAVIPQGAKHDIYDKKEAWDFKVKVKPSTWTGAHLFRAGNWLFVDEIGRDLLEKETQGWILFQARP